MFLYSQDDEDHVSPEDIHIQTQTSDDQAEQADVLDVLFRCINSLVILFSHPILISNNLATKRLTPCLLDCLNSTLFIQTSTKFLQQNLSKEKIHIRSIFLLFTCLDYCTLSTTTSTLQLIPSIRKILHFWCEIPQTTDDDTSPLILRLVRLINRLALSNKESIIQENLCAFLVPHFEKLCLTNEIIDDIISLFLTLSTTIIGKRHLRRLGYVQLILPICKRFTNFWHPLALLLTQRDLNQPSFVKKLIHLLTQRTIFVLQTLATASNDTSFDSTMPSTKNQAAICAIEWLILFRTNFLSFSLIINELINYTKKVNLINTLIDTILVLQQDEESLPKLIELMLELLWTFTFSQTTNIEEILQKRLDFLRWLKTNMNNSSTNIQVISQTILYMLNMNEKNLSMCACVFVDSFFNALLLDRTSINTHRSSPRTNNFICMINCDDSHQDLCITIRDRLQSEYHYTIELISTSSCESFDNLLYILDHSSLCIFYACNRMKTDNLAHFIHRYIGQQSNPIRIITSLIENECEFEGNWIESLSFIDLQSIHREIRRHFNHSDEHDIRSPPSRISDASTASHSRNFMNYPVPCWSADDVTEWCEATQGSFETLQPLVMRLNGSALVHLAEILSIEPASMYHSLNEELLQRTGSPVPLTEYVSLRSELQQLLVQQQNQQIAMSPTPTPDDTNKNSYRKKRWKKSRLCNIL